MVRTAYDVLGIGREASAEDIRRAFRALVRHHHPDRAGGDAVAHERFLELKAAYEILMDPDARALHDRDPEGALAVRIMEEQRAAQRLRRRKRLRRLYE